MQTLLLALCIFILYNLWMCAITDPGIIERNPPNKTVSIIPYIIIYIAY